MTDLRINCVSRMFHYSGQNFIRASTAVSPAPFPIPVKLGRKNLHVGNHDQTR